MRSSKRIHADSQDSTDLEYSTKSEVTSKDDSEIEGIDKVEISENRDVIEEYRVAVKKFMALSLFGRMYENVLLVTAVFSCAQYIYSTYKQYVAEDVQVAFSQVEVALAVVFMFDWTLCFALADNKLMHFTE